MPALITDKPAPAVKTGRPVTKPVIRAEWHVTMTPNGDTFQARLMTPAGKVAAFAFERSPECAVSRLLRHVRGTWTPLASERPAEPNRRTVEPQSVLSSSEHAAALDALVAAERDYS